MGGGEVLKKTKYFTIDDIPDELIPRSSKRDPNNRVYETRRWVNFKKKQILFSQNDGVPNYLRTRLGRFGYYGIWVSTISCFFGNIYLLNKYTSKK